VTEAADFPAGTAFVTAGGGGGGAETCKVLARQGSDVALTYRSSQAAAEPAPKDTPGGGRPSQERYSAGQKQLPLTRLTENR
jgi:NAD(P)-dependent dehydrogenase (short-subunit alcohol dehydrogenase family)